jgi:metal-sulfur cluster biosynthetic enzyme
MPVSEEDVYKAIETVIDPEVGFDIVSLGLIYGVKVEGDHANVIMTLSTRGCPLHELMQQWTKEAVLKVQGISTCTIDLVWEPAWNISMANDRVKKALGC